MPQVQKLIDVALISNSYDRHGADVRVQGV